MYSAKHINTKHFVLKFINSLDTVKITYALYLLVIEQWYKHINTLRNI